MPGVPLAQSAFRYLRGGWRLNVFASLSVWTSLRLVALRKRDGSVEEALRLVNDWAHAMSRHLALRVEHHGEVPTSGGPFLLVANHRSYADIPAILQGVSTTFLAKAEIADWPVLGRGARAAHTIFVDRESKPSRKQALVEIEKMLRRNHSVVVFPEGTTFSGPGLLPFRKGSMALAIKLGIPVVPVAVAYTSTEHAWVGDATFVGHLMKRMVEDEGIDVKVTFGSPMTDTCVDRLTERVRAVISQALGDEARTETQSSADESAASDIDLSVAHGST